MSKKRWLTAALVLFAVSAAAQTTSQELEPRPGLMKAGSPIYGFDLAWDDVRMMFGGPDVTGSVAYERASEIRIAQKRNHSKAVEKAATGLGKVASEADNRSTNGLQNAEKMLQQALQQNPGNASKGLQTALEHVKAAQERKPEKPGSMFGGKIPGQKNVITELDNQTGREDTDRGRGGGQGRP